MGRRSEPRRFEMPQH